MYNGARAGGRVIFLVIASARQKLCEKDLFERSLATAVDYRTLRRIPARYRTHLPMGGARNSVICPWVRII